MTAFEMPTSTAPLHTRQKREARQFTVVSLFTGGGGFDIGLEEGGRFAVRACVEVVPAFCDTLRRNRDKGLMARRDVEVSQADITGLDPAHLLATIGLKPGEVDLVVGGPPCQTFSTTGRRATVQDPRGTLLWQFLRFVDALKPKMFVMENVRGLMSAALRHRSIAERPERGGPPLEPDEEPGSVIRLFVRDLHDEYRLDCFEVNAVNYGAPQLRERVLFVGNRFNRLVDFPEPTHGDQLPVSEPDLFGKVVRPLEPFHTLGAALSGLRDPTPVLMDFSPRKKRFLAMIPPGGNWRCLPEEIAREAMGRAFLAKGGRSGWWRRLTFDLPAPTILTMPNHAGTALCHPSETRALTLRECARVQEFPDAWEFCGTPAEQYAQVGNAVPVRLGRVCAEVVATHLDAIDANGEHRAPGNYPPCRVVYVKSHIRTRRWFANGQKVLWLDGEQDNAAASYSVAKTLRKVRNLPKAHAS
jgi:DNA (cytosine-5)-methyltransferase 1